jgi:glycosyltransferase involved in cell wall biosynthesis
VCSAPTTVGSHGQCTLGRESFYGAGSGAVRLFRKCRFTVTGQQLKTVALVTDLWPSTTDPTNGVFVSSEVAAVGSLGYRHLVLVPRLLAPGLHRRIWGQHVNGAQQGWTDPPQPHSIHRYANARIPRGGEVAVRSRSIVRLLSRPEVAPDLVHGHFLLHTGTSAVRAAARLKIPAVVTLHGTDYRALVGEFPIQDRHRTAMRDALHSADRVLVVDRGMVDGLTRLGVDRGRVAHIPMGVDETMFTPRDRGAARAEFGLVGPTRVVLFVGRPTTEKGFEVLERAAELLTDVAFFAAGPRRPSQVITALGSLSQRQLADWLVASDVVCLPSFAEGTPVSLGEALACGTPVVATRVGGIPDLVEESVAGVLVEPGDEQSLANALRIALDRSWDPVAIRATSSPYWWSAVGPKIAAVYDELTA